MHRFAQFVAHVRARVEPEEEAAVRRILPEGGWRLFDAMPVADRRHALDVIDKLLRDGHDDRDLLAAALLHDAAKGHRLRLWHRVSGVLLESLAPTILQRLATADPRSWRHPFHVYLHHGPMSAMLAAEAGCPPRVGSLIRGESDTDSDAALLRALERADDAS